MEVIIKAIGNRGGALLAAAIAFTTGACAAASEPYPVRPVRVIAAFSPGGYVDLVARLVAGPLSTALGQQVVSESAQAPAALSEPSLRRARLRTVIRSQWAASVRTQSTRASIASCLIT